MMVYFLGLMVILAVIAIALWRLDRDERRQRAAAELTDGSRLAPTTPPASRASPAASAP